MTRISSILTAIIVIASALGIDAPARADLVTYTVSTGPGMRTTDFTQSLTIPTFDPAKGHLTEVLLKYTINSNITGMVTNFASKDETFSVAEATVYKLSLGSTAILSNALSASNTYTDIRPMVPRAFGEFSQTANAGPVEFTSGAVFNAFEGVAHTMSLSFGTNTDTQVVGGGGNIGYDIHTLAQATVTVEYFYLPTSMVPEPASISMCVVGGLFAGSFWVAKRRGRTKPLV